MLQEDAGQGCGGNAIAKIHFNQSINQSIFIASQRK